jgi:hypothetical protein
MTRGTASATATVGMEEAAAMRIAGLVGTMNGAMMTGAMTRSGTMTAVMTTGGTKHSVWCWLGREKTVQKYGTGSL